MSYQAEISRSNPTCFLFLIDQSGSMADPIMGVQGNISKAEFISDALNRIIQNLIIKASKDYDVLRYFQIGAIGYSGEGVKTAFGGTLSEENLVWVDELYKKPIRIEEREKKEPDGAGGVITTKTRFPVWIDPLAKGGTPMCAALKHAKEILEKWVNEHPNSYPPTVINLTDGESTDGDPRSAASELKSLSTMDGNVVLLTLHVSSNQFSKQIFFPNSPDELVDTPSKIAFEMSSPLTINMLNNAKEMFGIELPDGAIGIVYNGPFDKIVNALEIGTRPANLR